MIRVFITYFELVKYIFFKEMQGMSGALQKLIT